MAGNASSIEAGRAAVRVWMDTSAIDAGARKIQAQLRGLALNFRTLGAPLQAIGTTALLSFGSILGSLAWPTSLAANMEMTQAAFKTMLGSGEKAKGLLTDIAKLGAETPFEFPELADAGKKLLAFGVKSEDVVGELRRIGDVASGLGIPIGELAELYGKAKVQGRLFAQDINQLTGRGIPIITELAQQFGVTEDKVKELVESGQVNFGHLQTAIEHMTSAGGQFAGGMAAASQTVIGKWSTLKDNIGATARSVGEALLPVLSATIDGFNRVLGPISQFVAANKNIGLAVAGLATAGVVLGGATLAIGTVISFAVPAVSAVVSIGASFLMLVAAITPVGIAVGALVAAVVVAEGVIVGSVLYVAYQLGSLSSALSVVKTAFADASAFISNVMGSISDALSAGDLGLAAQIGWAGVKVAAMEAMIWTLAAVGDTLEELSRISIAWNVMLIQNIVETFGRLPQLIQAAIAGQKDIGQILTEAIVGNMFAADGMIGATLQNARDELAALQAQAASLKAKKEAEQKATAEAAKGAAPQPTAATDSNGSKDSPDAIDQRIEAIQREIRVLERGETAATLYDLALEGATQKELEAVKALLDRKDALDKQKKADEEAARKADELKQRGEALADSLKTPAEKFNESITEVRELLAAGAIDETTALRAVAREVSALQGDLPRANEFARSGSNEALVAIENQRKAIMAAQSRIALARQAQAAAPKMVAGQAGQKANKPQEIQAQQKQEIEQSQLDTQQDILKVVQQPKKVIHLV